MTTSHIDIPPFVKQLHILFILSNAETKKVYFLLSGSHYNIF